MFDSVLRSGGVALAPPDDALPPLWLLPEPPEPDVDALLARDPSRPEPLTAAERVRLAMAEPDYASAVALTAGLDPRELSGIDLVNYLSLRGRLDNQAAALRMQAVAALAGPEPADERARRDDFADCEVAAALSLSRPTGARLVHAARHLHARLPATAAAFDTGQIGLLQALSIAEATYTLDPALLPRLERIVLERAAGQSPGQTRSLVRKTVARLDAEGLARREREAREAADVCVIHGDDGTAQVVADYVPSADAAVIESALEAYARSRRALGDERTLGQLRVAALVAWATAAVAAPDAPTSHGRPYRVNVTIDLPTFLGLTDHPAEVTGGGIIPAAVARALVKDSRLRRLIIDPATGHLLDYGRHTYRVPADLAAAIEARYVTTTSPGSTAPARSGERDHDWPWSAGGATDPDNLHAPGQRHHNAKTRGGWTTRVCGCGTVTWRTPRGATYRVEPHDYRLGP